MTDTFAILRNRVIAAVGQVSGTSVQTYSEPRVDEALKTIFLTAIRKVWWPQYMKWYELTLDGTLGIVTSSTFGDEVVDPRDIRVVIPTGQDKPIPLLPAGRNPFNLTGTTVQYWEPLPASSASVARRMQFWPKASVGTIKVHARNVPTVVEGLVNYLDDNLIVAGATWLILEQEDINPNAAQLAERLFNETYADIMKQFSEQPLENPLTGYNSGNYLSDWSLI